MRETTMNTYKNFEKNANIILAITCVLCACFMWRVRVIGQNVCPAV